MFNSLTGIVTGKFSKKLFLQTQGVEWAIFVPDSELDNFSLGEEARVFTYLNHYDSGMDLYGFSSDEVRTLFFDLLKVDGIGPKGALKILSSVKYSDLVSVLERGDLGVLEKIQGIGKKTAAKMLLALQGKLTVLENQALKSVNIQKTNDFEVVIKSLCEMGYDRIKIEEKVEKIVEELKSDSEFLKKTQTEKEDFIFRKVLVEMAK